MKIGPRPNDVEPGFQRARTHWIRGVMAFGWPDAYERDADGAGEI
jgi:hypothetical protein